MEKVLSVLPQAVAAGASVKSTNGNLVDVSQFDYMLVSCEITALSGSPTAVVFTAQESDTNAASGQADVSGASVSFLTTDIAAGKSKAFEVRLRGRKQFFGLKIAVTAGTSATVRAEVWGMPSHDSTEVAALSATVTAAALA
jgi:hypothetical protein